MIELIENICMNMLMIKMDNSIRINDTAYIYKGINHIKELSNYLNTIPYELICNISKRVERKYIK